MLVQKVINRVSDQIDSQATIDNVKKRTGLMNGYCDVILISVKRSHCIFANNEPDILEKLNQVTVTHCTGYCS